MNADDRRTAADDRSGRSASRSRMTLTSLKRSAFPHSALDRVVKLPDTPPVRIAFFKEPSEVTSSSVRVSLATRRAAHFGFALAQRDRC